MCHGAHRLDDILLGRCSEIGLDRVEVCSSDDCHYDVGWCKTIVSARLAKNAHRLSCGLAAKNEHEQRHEQCTSNGFDDVLLSRCCEITVDNIITHGDTAAVNGVITADSGDIHAFCEVLKFEEHSKDATIKSIDASVIEMV